MNRGWGPAPASARAVVGRSEGRAVASLEPLMRGTLSRRGDHLRARAPGGDLPARAILGAVLEGLRSIGPGRLTPAGHNLGDVRRHPAAGGEGLDAGPYPCTSSRPSSIVERRALTVALLDEIAAGVRQRPAMSAEALPLCKVLEGGAGRAGREQAARRRPGGAPPLRLPSDGTVF